ncbi:MAG TPA: TonB-dependent siderophore receptor [Gemmatimonadaceae bacterium]|nr:TonB-dependent siderophore receptor [Gemmatimonadaceae bacterium]
MRPLLASSLLLVAAATSAAAQRQPADSAPRRAASDSTARTLAPVHIRDRATRRSGYAPPRTSTATRTDTPLLDVPQAITVIGRSLVADQGMQSMADVVRYIPGITMGQGEGHRDAPTIRGTSSTADFFVDGVRDDAQYLRDLYNVERIEALKGANAMTFGRGGGGGVLNRVTKDASWTPTRALQLEGGSFDHRRATLDVGGGVGSGLALRLNGMSQRSSLYRESVVVERAGVNPTAALVVGGAVLRLGLEHFSDRRTVDRGIPSFAGRPSSADTRTFFGDPDASRSVVTVNGATASFEHGSEQGLLLRNRSRAANYDKFYRNVFPGALNAAGTHVALSAYASRHDRQNLFNQTDLVYTHRAGAVKQTLLAGVEVGRQVTGNYRETGYFNGTATSMSVPFASPSVAAPVSWRQSASDADNRVRATVAAAYLQDQLSLGRHLQLIAGVRLDDFSLQFENRRTAQKLERHDRMVSPRAGVVVKPASALSLYGTFSVSHLPSSGDQFSSLTATTRTLEPERFENRELGVKWDLSPVLALTAATYRLDRTNSAAPDPADPTRLVQTGAQRTDGYEVGLTGEITSAWQVAAGWAQQRAVLRSRTSAAAAGATVPLVPHHTASLWNRWQMSRRVGAGLGVVHQAESYAAIDNSVRLPAFTRVDAALFATLTRELKLQANLENLFDVRYHATSHGNNNIMPGAPRHVRVSLSVTP